MGYIVLDMTNLAYQPTTMSREQPGHPKRHVTFAMSARRPAYPTHAPDTHEDEDEDDTSSLVRPASRKEPAKEKRYLERAEETSIWGRRRTQFEGPSSEALPRVYRTIQEEDDSLGYSWKIL